MLDRRESILVRLLELAAGVDGVAMASRNRPITSESRLPAICMFDGPESADDTDPLNRPVNAPRRVTMSPQLWIQLAGLTADVGPDLNVFRRALVKAVSTDATLIALAHLIRYQGCGHPTVEQGRAAEGALMVDFAITYMLKPDEL